MPRDRGGPTLSAMMRAQRAGFERLGPVRERDGGHTLLMDVLPAVALIAFLVFVSPLAADKGGHGPLDAEAYALLVVAGGSFAIRRRFPVLTYAIALAATVAYVVTYSGGPIFVAAFAGLIMLVASKPRTVWIPAAIVGAVALIVAEIMDEGVS